MGNIEPTDKDFHDAPRPVRVRFAPTVPNNGGAFLHCGHMAMLIVASHIADKNNCPLDFRFDSTPDTAASLDCMNAVAWLQIPIRRFYVLPIVNEMQLQSFAKGDLSLAKDLTSWHLSAGFDDLYEENHTIIVRGVEFQYKQVRKKIEATERVWGTKPYSEMLFPLLMRDGQKMSKSLDNSIHWSVLRENEPADVKRIFIDVMETGENYEWKPILKQLAMRLKF